MTTRIAFTLLSLALLSACSGNQPRLSNADFEPALEGARSDLAARASGADAFQVVDSVWLGATPVRRDTRPAAPELESRIVLTRGIPMTLAEVADLITTRAGINTTVSDDAVEASNRVMSGAGAAGAAIPANLLNLQTPDAPAPVASSPSLASLGGAGKGLVIDYSGPLRGLLDHVAARTNTSWRYQGGRIEFVHLDTRIFDIEILPGATTITGNITNQSIGGQQQGGGGQSSGATASLQGGSQTSMSVEVDRFTAIQKTAGDMLSAKGKMTASASLGQLVVTDTPSVLSRIERYVQEVNEVVNRQVVLDVQVYAVENRSSNGYAISWDLVWQSVSKQIGVKLLGSNSVDGGTTAAGIVMDPTSPFSGTKLFLDALATQGNVRQLTSVSSVTVSGRPVPVQVAEEIGYQESSQVSLVPDVGQQVTRTQGKITTGFSMVLLPMMTKQKDVLLQAQINLSSLRELRQLGSVADGSYTELPLVDSRQLMQEVRLASGQTLVLTGFEQETLRSDAKGVGNARFTALGGASSSEKKNSTLVILITPRAVS